MFLAVEPRQEIWLFSKHQHKLIRVKAGVRVPVRKVVILLPDNTKGFHNLSCLLSSLQAIHHTFVPNWNLSKAVAWKNVLFAIVYSYLYASSVTCFICCS
jgi:hypothetical protein